MRKAELLKRIPKKKSGKTRARVIRVCGKRVLMLTFRKEQRSFHGSRGERLEKATDFAHFTWDTGYLTYNRRTGAWSRESAAWLGSIESPEEEPSQRAIREFPGGSCMLRSVFNYESDIRWRAEQAAEQRKQKKIDEFMQKTTPPLPKDFMRVCRRMYRGKRVNLKFFQPFEQGVIERMFWIEQMPDKEVGVTEICRAYAVEYGGGWSRWFYGEFWYTHGRRQKFWGTKSGSVVNVLPKWYEIYDNLDSLPLTPAQKACVRGMSGYADPSLVLAELREFPETETLIRAGMRRFVREMTHEWNVVTRERLKRLACLAPEQRRMLAEVDGGKDCPHILAACPKLRKESLLEIAGIKSEMKAGYLTRIADKGINMNHVLTLLKKTGGIKEEQLRKYLDYLDMAEAAGRDIHDEIIYRSKRWEEFHDRYVEERTRQQAAEAARRRKKELKAKAEKFAGIARDRARNARIFGWTDGTYQIIVPQSYEDLITEGQLQHHCVGASDHYMLNMAMRESWILFLRKCESPETPYYTIETDGKKILQAYGSYDRKPDWETVDAVLNAWMKSVRKNINKVLKAEEKAAEQAKQEEKEGAAQETEVLTAAG